MRLLLLPDDSTTLKRSPSTEAMSCLVVVFPLEPVTAMRRVVGGISRR
jgi:hypothetical protein